MKRKKNKEMEINKKEEGYEKKEKEMEINKRKKVMEKRKNKLLKKKVRKDRKRWWKCDEEQWKENDAKVMKIIKKTMKRK